MIAVEDKVTEVSAAPQLSPGSAEASPGFIHRAAAEVSACIRNTKTGAETLSTFGQELGEQ